MRVKERQKAALLTSSGTFHPLDGARRPWVFSQRGCLFCFPSCLQPRWQPLSTSPCPGRVCTCPLAVLPQKALRPRPGEREGGHGTHSLADRVSETREAGRAVPRFHGRSGFPDLSPPDGVLGSMENMQCHAYKSLRGHFLHQTRL